MRGSLLDLWAVKAGEAIMQSGKTSPTLSFAQEAVGGVMNRVLVILVVLLLGAYSAMAAGDLGNGASEFSDRDQYERILTLFRDGDIDGALYGFTTFLLKYPKSDLAPNACYWLGESYYAKRDFRKAIETYEAVRLNYPDSEKVPAAMLKTGYAYLASKDKKRALLAFEQVVILYPKSPEAIKASEKLLQFNKYAAVPNIPPSGTLPFADEYDRPRPKTEDVKEEPVPISTGSSFIVSRQGHVLTNNHVIEGCATIRAITEGRKTQLTVVATDPSNDLAVLKLPAPVLTTARFREGRTIRPGDGVIVVGFPFHGLLASEANVTIGSVSALAGLGNNTRFLQITAPVQPGNSGGPLLDERGQIVGVVVSKLDALSVAKITGDIPQNINFAINGSVAKSFLDSHSIEYEADMSSRKLEPAEIGAAARKFTLLLECHRQKLDAEHRKK